MKITNKEAIKAIKCNYPPENYTVLREALDMAIETLRKADKYKWHDLRKNPDDLPEADEYGRSEFVFVMTGTPEWYSCEWAYYHHDKKLWSIYEQDVFAWRYIEPFKENKDDE